MADLAVTANLVVAGANATVDRSGNAGETIAAGKAVYRDATTRKWKLSDSNSVDLALRRVDGISLNGAALDQPLAVHKQGDLTIGAALTAGVSYFLSDTPGGICVDGDVGAGENVILLGVAKSATVLAVDIQTPGVTR